LAELLPTNQVKGVYHGQHGTPGFKRGGAELFDPHQRPYSGDESD
jgi:hypothetical protein